MSELMQVSADGVKVRMYRLGHGDCFLLALPREPDAETSDPPAQQRPVYVLVDCGFKPGSAEGFLAGQKIDDVVAHIGSSTGRHLDLMIVTHEHQDHVNGITADFDDFTIDEAWFAWTENPGDDVANELRKRHKDQLLGLLEARRQLALAVGDEDAAVLRMDSLLGLELGEDLTAHGLDDALAAAADPSRSRNKVAMKRVKDRARLGRGLRFLRPGETRDVPGTGVRAYVLGPPRRADLLSDEDPIGDEAFPDAAHGLSFAAAVASGGGGTASPFSPQHHVSRDEALDVESPACSGFFASRYGREEEGVLDKDNAEVPSDAGWRRIDEEWLYAAESLALKLNRGINNTSVVLALELPRTKKVLLFVGDAQRGNWISWDDQTWRRDDGEVDARDLLSRTVLYKVGHHGSHNATLAGRETDDHPNLSWMALGPYAQEFTALVPAVEKWALSKNTPPWRHPLPSIKRALMEKARGRVLQTDTDEPACPAAVAEAEWNDFRQRVDCQRLYFDLTVSDR